MSARVMLVAASLLGVAHAAAIAQTDAPADLKQVVVQWSNCRADAVRARIATDAPAATLADEAMARCAGFEARARQLWEKHYGRGSGRQIATMATGWRNQMIASITSLRAGTAPADPHAAWGRCVGERTRPTQGQTAAAAVDAALAACAAPRERLRASIAAKHGATVAAGQIATLQSTIRDQVIARLNSPPS